MPLDVTTPPEVILKTSARTPSAIAFTTRSKFSEPSVTSVATDSITKPVSRLLSAVSVARAIPVPIPSTGVPVVSCVAVMTFVTALLTASSTVKDPVVVSGNKSSIDHRAGVSASAAAWLAYRASL